jgi:dynactin complex subunit
MKSNRAEHLAEKLRKVEADLKLIRKELHASKQKNRDLEKRYKSKFSMQEQSVILLKEALEKKTLPVFQISNLLHVINTTRAL